MKIQTFNIQKEKPTPSALSFTSVLRKGNKWNLLLQITHRDMNVDHNAHSQATLKLTYCMKSMLVFLHCIVDRQTDIPQNHDTTKKGLSPYAN